MDLKKLVLIIAYVLILLTPLVTLIVTSGGIKGILSSFSSAQTTWYFLVRFAGLYAIVILFNQVMIGAFMLPLRRVFGSKMLILHITQGLIGYTLLLLHPLFNTLSLAQIMPLEKAVQFILPDLSIEQMYYNLGRLAVVLFTIAVLAGALRTKQFFTNHWRKFHILNYIAFPLVVVHSYFVGSDTHALPFVLLYPVFIIGLLVAFFYRRILRE